MGLRLFADHCVPTSIVQGLGNAGHSVLVLRDQIPTRSEDTIVIAKAQELDTILLSLNGDFSDIVTYPPQKYQGIVAIQIRNHPEVIPAVLRRLLDYTAIHRDQNEYLGKLFLVEPHRIRIR